jgi:hypothetical protein
VELTCDPLTCERRIAQLEISMQLILEERGEIFRRLRSLERTIWFAGGFVAAMQILGPLIVGWLGIK